MASTTQQRQPGTTIAVLEADEHVARRLADFFVEGFAADDGAVSLVDSGQGRRNRSRKYAL